MVSRRGAALAVLVWLSFIGLTVLLALGARAMVRQRILAGSEVRRKARSLAESGLATAIARIRLEHSFGCKGESLIENMAYPEDSDAGFRVEFSGPWRSCNNWQGDAPVYRDESRREVYCPASCIRLVARGFYRGQEARAECLLTGPPFSSALVSAGSLNSSHVLLGSVPKDFDVRQGISLDDLEPTQMQAGGSLEVRGPSVIIGEARSSGKAAWEASVDLRRGSVVGDSRVDEIPELDLQKFDFSSREGVQTLPSSRFANREKLSGLLQWTGPELRFEQGLTLNGGVLRVRGNLVIDGGISGQGAIICDGNVTVKGGSSLEADNQCAILAGGGITVTGPSSYFQGLLYAKGSEGVHIANATVLGTVISASPQAPMEIHRSTLAFQRGKSGKVSFDLGWGVPTERAFAPNSLRSSSVSGTLRLRQIQTPDGKSRGPTPAELLRQGVTQLKSEHFEILAEDGSVRSINESEFSTLADFWISHFQAMNRTLRESQRSVADAPEGGFNIDLNRYLVASSAIKILWLR